MADGLLAALLTVIALPMLFLPSENFERLFATSFRDPGLLGRAAHPLPDGAADLAAAAPPTPSWP